MDSSEAVKVIQERISRLEPENVAKKIIGYIYFQGLSDQEMIRLALGPDTLIHNLIQKAKTARILAPQPVISPPISPTINPSPLSDPSFQFSSYSPPSPSPRSFSAPTPFHGVPAYWDAMHSPPFKMMPFSEPIPEDYGMQMGLNDQLLDSMSIRGCRNSPRVTEYPPIKTCQYFNRGYCKHGSNCRYMHVESLVDSYPHMFGPNSSYEGSGDDQVFSPGTLEKLEAEITEILKSRRGNPVSIASLPMMYYEKYGKTLQAEGYLTESQRHGKAGYSLTKLLARLKNNIRLIDRPHGQHCVILAEDAPKYMDIRERNDPGPIVSGSRQIYLTFPSESTFTEEDVSNYFNTFGPVQDVRIPCQQKRMFGFVTFASSDTVKVILSKGNPHYVCGARVLVKPYREKSKLVERKYLDKFEFPMYYNSHPIDMDPELPSSWESSRMYRRQLMEGQLMDEHKQQQALELETIRFSQLQLASKSVPTQSYMGFSMPEDNLKFPSAERFNYLIDVLKSGSTSDGNPKFPVNNCGDQESGQGHSLPDSPFASVVASSISAVI